MPQENNSRSWLSPVQLLKGGAFAFVLLGGGMIVWGIDKWIRYPEARASQFGFEAPLWPAFLGVTLLGTTVAVALLWTTARRVEDGEELFVERPRRHPEVEKESRQDQS